MNREPVLETLFNCILGWGIMGGVAVFMPFPLIVRIPIGLLSTAFAVSIWVVRRMQ